MNKFEILLNEIKECNIRTQSQEVQKVLDYLKHFAGGLGGDWISVDDKLPPDNEFVLVYVYGQIKVYFYAVSDDVGELCHWWADEWGDFHSDITDGVVTHWMLLPQPPKE